MSEIASRKQNSTNTKISNNSTLNDDNVLVLDQSEYNKDIESDFSKRPGSAKKPAQKENAQQQRPNPWNPTGATKSPLKNYNTRKNDTKQAPISRVPSSPMKRSKYDNDRMDIDSAINNGMDSPSKRQRTQQKLPVAEGKSVSSFKLGLKFEPSKSKNSDRPTSAEASSASNEKKFASTPKIDRKAAHTTRVKELINRSQQATERNLSNSWADIIDELEEQTKELNDYAEKICDKYKLNKDQVMKNLECDVEILRKRQKQINYGKVTQEYQNYLLAMHKADRKTSHPKTPNKFRKCSRRQWDGLVKHWRKFLHAWNENPEAVKDFKNSLENDEDKSGSNTFGGMSNISIDDYELVDADE